MSHRARSAAGVCLIVRVVPRDYVSLERAEWVDYVALGSPQADGLCRIKVAKVSGLCRILARVGTVLSLLVAPKAATLCLIRLTGRRLCHSGAPAVC